MKTWTQFVETLGGLPVAPPNYAQSARPVTPGGMNGTVDLGQVHVHLVGHTLQIDSAGHSISLNLTPDQVKTLMAEVGG